MDIDNKTEDFDFDSTSENDGNDWDDIDILDESNQIFNKSQHDMIINDQNECWKCPNCSMINNVVLTIDKYNMQCCGCNNVSYIPDKTKIFKSSTWNTPNDYLLKNNLIKQVWICTECTLKNDMTTNSCIACNTQKILQNAQLIHIPIDNIELLPIGKQFVSDSQDAEISENTENDENNSKQSNISISSWECPNCHILNKNPNINEKECNICGCFKPNKFKTRNIIELKVFGFCRINVGNICIPIVILKLCVEYIRETDNFLFHGAYDISRKLVVDHLFTSPRNNYLSSGDGYNHVLCGQNIAKLPLNEDDDYIYQWKVKINVVPKEKTTFKLFGVAVGVIGDNDLRSGRPLLQTGVPPFATDTAYGIYGNGKYNAYKQFCEYFKNNDIITLRINFKNDTLSYGINNKWYGIAFESMPKINYRVLVCVRQSCVNVKFVDYMKHSYDDVHYFV